MRRVSVVGNSGSGKSTLGRALAAKLDVPYVELDSIFHQPNWTPLAKEDFQARVSAIVDQDGWVVDGNYSAVRPIVWQRADTVVWLDLPRRTVMRQVCWRTLRRVAGQVELWNGNRERWRDMFTLGTWSSSGCGRGPRPRRSSTWCASSRKTDLSRASRAATGLRWAT